MAVLEHQIASTCLAEASGRRTSTLVRRGSRRQAKFQINLKHRNPEQRLMVHLKLEFGAYLGFVICDLGF